ncbi:MAG: phenylacetate--CoA ligase family protein, partial [Candidatus Bathyarchaeota archaeon]
DIGVLSGESCPCGRTLPLLKEIQGRTTDFLLATDGRVVSGNVLGVMVRELPGVERYQVVQHSRDRLEVRLVTRPPFGAGEEARLVRDCKARLGPGVRVLINRVREIPAEASGKYRYLVSHLPAEERSWTSAAHV